MQFKRKEIKNKINRPIIFIFLLTKRFLQQGLPKLKRALWGDKPEGLLPENCPNFSFFLFGPGPFGHL
jgi:hypothetical protein